MNGFVRLTLLALALMLAGCGAGSPTAAAVPADLPPMVAVASQLLVPEGGVPRAGEPAPDFRFTMSDGTERRLSDLRGHKVLLNFWATWCAPCKEEMPELQRLANEYGDAVQVIGINKLELPEAIGPFARDMDISFTLVANPEGDISDRYGAKNIPLTYFVNTDGSIGYVHIGVLTYDEAKAQVERLS